MNDHLDNETREYMNAKAEAALLDAKRLYMMDATLDEIGAALDEAVMYAGCNNVDDFAFSIQNDMVIIELGEKAPEAHREGILARFDAAIASIGGMSLIHAF